MSSDESKKAVSRIRTFAGDLDAERAKRGKARPSSQPKAPEKETKPTPKAKKSVPAPKQMPKIVVPAKKKSPKPPAPSKPSTPPTSTKIPAFHELKKSVDSKPKETPEQKSSKVPKKPKIKTNGSKKKKPQRNIGYDSMVITDTKTDRFKLFPSIIASVKSWFKKITTRKRKAAPKYTVPETERRKGVIQKATSKTGTIFTADNETLKEQIRRRQRSKAGEGGEENELETSWSPFTEAGYNLLEAPDQPTDTTSNVTVEFKKQTKVKSAEKPIQVVVPSQPKEIVPIAPTEKETITQTEEQTQPTEEDAAAPTETSEEETTEAEVYEDTNVLTVTDNTPYTTNVPTLTPEEDLEAEDDQVLDERAPGFLNRFDTNTLTIILVVSVVGLIVFVFVTKIIVTEVRERAATEAIMPVQAESILRDSQLVTISLTADNLDQLPQLIKTAITSAPAGLVELPVVTLDGNSVNPSYLFEALRFQTLPSLEQSITVARLITIDQSDPALVVQFVDKDTVRGGMLSWEETMANDLRSLYAIPSEIPEEFTDEMIGGVDVRTMRHNGEIVLIYGFISDSTLLIAASEADFTQIQQAQ